MVGALQSGRFTIPSGGPGTFTLYPSAQSGSIFSSSTTSYTLARSGENLYVPPSGDGYSVGQYPPDEFNTIWECYEGFLDFDTSGVVGLISSATLSLGLAGDVSEEDFTVQARTHDWGTTLTTADWVAGASLSTKTLLATLPTLGIGAEGYKNMTESGTALRNAINQAGVTRMLLCSDRQVAGTIGFLREYLRFHPYNHATLKPKLVVVTT